MVQRNYLTMDGSQAAAHVAYAYSETAAIYPITPSSPMSEIVDEWAGAGRTNIFGRPLLVSEMQSEIGAAGAVHGALSAGALAVTFTSSQGLLLMLPNLYRIAGELLPGVFHVASRTIATHALSIFGDHSDIYACRQSGAAIFAAGSVQEVMDLAPVAHLSALEGRVPFLNFFDGFRTSHELQKIAVWDYRDLAELFDHKSYEAFRRRALHPHNGRMYGSAQNPDIFFQAREASNPYYDALPGIVEANLQKINEKLGSSYGLLDYYGSPDATHVIVAMGSVCETIREYLASCEASGSPQEKYGLIAVHLYRPFPAKRLAELLPKTVTQISVLSRTKEPGAPGEPLYLDVLSALRENPSQESSSRENPYQEISFRAPSSQENSFRENLSQESPSQKNPFRGVKIFSGRYGLGSKDTTPAQIAAVYRNREKNFFTIGIEDDVTHHSLPLPPIADPIPADTISCKFWGLGGDGTVSATKNAVKIIGDHTSLYVQGYFEYDSKKSRGLTISHLRFGKTPIHSAYLIQSADIAVCHNPVYLHKYNIVQEIKDGGSFLLNCPYRGEELEKYLPEAVKSCLARRHIRFFLIDAQHIGKEIGLNDKTSTILQAAFFRVSAFLPLEEAEELMMAAARKSYGKMGEKIIRMNSEAIHRGLYEVTEVTVPSRWSSCSGEPAVDNPLLPDRPELLDYVRKLQQPMVDQRGNSLPVSAFLPYADGFTPPGSTAHERRNVATEVPVWRPENCIQCGQCSYVCPHAVIRITALTGQEAADAPAGMAVLPMTGMPDYQFAVTISQTDCTGCGSCAAICPGRQGGASDEDKKALLMRPVHEHEEHQEYFDYAKTLPVKRDAVEKFKPHTVKGSQLLKPYMEFSGACAGCGETPYVKLLTQLFGPRMYIANATGCSSIWSNSSPSSAYCLDAQGCGPAWSNSLFEDAAEFGFGMLMAQQVHGETGENGAIQWVIGGDGWAYDIGFGGLDHVLASGQNINILVLDTEVYSNTGGQASKSTPLGSTARFVTGGKKTRKKDLAAMAMTYGNVYVAQTAMGADLSHTVKTFTEAAAYPGPSLVIAYSTCIAHGIKAGLGSSPHEEKKAVEAGYFHLFRFNPALVDKHQNPFHLDSKKPTIDYEEFLSGENRYAILARKHPEQARVLFEAAAKQAAERYQYLKKLRDLYEP